MSAGRSDGRQDGTNVARGRPHILVPGAAGVLSVLVVLVLLLTCFYAPLSSVDPGPIAGTTIDDSHSSEKAKAARPSNSNWDWDAYVNELGKVRVILSTDSGEPLDTVMDRAVRKVDSSSSWSADGKGASLMTVKARSTRAMQILSVELAPGTLTSLLANEPSLWAYPDLRVNATGTGSNIVQTGADRMWSEQDAQGAAVTGAGVTVAVIDTGIDYTHPDLGGGFGPGYKVAGGYDFVNDDADPRDDNGHGTHVAGIIAADGGIQGVAPDATLYAYKALGADGSGFMSNVVLSVDAAVDPNGDGSPADHLDIISMSLGGDGDTDDPICLAVQRAVEAGVLVVVAAGNSGPSMGTVSSPGLSPYSLTVGAVDSDHKLANFSSRGPTADLLMKPDMSAPGVAILSTIPYSGATTSSPTGYKEMSGTSMATPHVSGAAALLIQSHPTWNVTKLKSALITGAMSINESFWEAGSGELWVPGADDLTLFSSQPMVSCGRADSSSHSVTIYNGDGIASLAVSASDWYALSADGELQDRLWTNYSTRSPATVTLPTSGSGTVSVSVTASESAQEGYFDGYLALTSAGTSLTIPFGYLILGELSVHVLDLSGNEVFDPYGGVWVYSIPDANVAIGVRGGGDTAPPAEFLLPSGTYSVHAAGHQLLYTYSDPYFLSTTVTLDRMESKSIALDMRTARAVSIDLLNDEGNQIYVKDFRMFGRYEGERNLSFDLTGSDYSIFGSELFSLPANRSLRLSDTLASVGIELSGFSYSSAMWDFMSLNWQHWYEFKNGLSTAFLIETTADMQYLLAWEFPTVDSLVPSELTYDLGSCGVYVTKYDIPGAIETPWCNWDTHRSIGGDAAFYVRRDTDTSLNPFFSGMTRTTIVSGVFSELYFPTSIFSGYVERSFYDSDYSQLLHAATISEIYLPNRYFLTPLDPTYTNETLGNGPFYASVRMANTDSSLVLFHPLLRDHNGWRVGGTSTPMLTLYRGSSLTGIYQLSEHLARPDAKRIIDLSSSGSYMAKITYSPLTQLYNEVEILLGFTVPSADMDPPEIVGMELAQRFAAGQSLPVGITVQDRSSISSVAMEWRAGASASWAPLSVANLGGGSYASSIQTAAYDSGIDVRFTVTDAQGNYLKYTTYNASMRQEPAVFEIGVAGAATDVEYRTSGPVTVPLVGRLTDGQGNPLHLTAAVPVELTVDGRKVGMILDEYISGTTNVHNGTIRFDWALHPTQLFTGPDQYVTVTARFDLGLYQPVTRTFTLHSIPDESVAPTITLVAPANGSLIASGTSIDLSIVDDGSFTAQYAVNGGTPHDLVSPWDISTSGWSDGGATVVVTATDDDMLTATATCTFEIDALAPAIEIVDPPEGVHFIPRNHTVVVSVDELRLESVVCSIDGGEWTNLPLPYTISTVGWSVGTLHTVQVTATDLVGHTSSDMATFEIADSSVVVWLDSPADGGVIRAGTPITLSVVGDGVISCTWDAGSGPAALDAPYDIATDGWPEGPRTVTVHAWNDLGDSYTITLNITVDNTPPTIALLAPVSGSLVGNKTSVLIQFSDLHYSRAYYALWGQNHSVTRNPQPIPLTSSPQDGLFIIDVTAEDQAGNIATAQYVFIMDTHAPVIRLDGFSDAMSPGHRVNITVLDDHLSEVFLELDGTVQAIPAKHPLDTNLSLGLHSMKIEATDQAGNSANMTASFFIDGTVPVVSMTSSTSFASNSSFEVVAAVTDDIGIAKVTLYYSLRGGEYLQLPMSYNGLGYVTVLPAEALWDGMDIYVVAVDTAGNTATGESQVLHGTDSGSGSPDDGSGLDWLFAGVNGLLILGGVAAAAAIIIMLIMYRRKEDDGQWEIDISKPSAQEPKKEAVDIPRLSVPEPRPERPAYVMAAEAPQEAAPEPAPAKVPEPPVRAQISTEPVARLRKVSLLESIPPQVAAPEDENQKFYDDLLQDLEKVEREMNETARRGSVFMNDEEFEKLFDLEERLDTGEPKQVSGLKWKKLLE